jgi:DNA-directed RNA polymerase specialized sigma24 family protein
LSQPDSTPARFGDISTHQDLLGNTDGLLDRYGKAIRGYLLALLHDEDAVQDVLLGLRVKMLDGRFTHWTPGQGRFRFYLKRTVLNEALQHLRKHRNRRLEKQVEDLAQFPEGSSGAGRDAWLDLYRQAVLGSALRSLRAYQEQHPDNIFHTLVELLLGEAVNDWDSGGPPPSDGELATSLGRLTGRSYTLANIAQQKRRARQKLAEFLAAEVQRTVPESAPDQVREELRHLGFLTYVEGFLPACASPDGETTDSVG